MLFFPKIESDAVTPRVATDLALPHCGYMPHRRENPTIVNSNYLNRLRVEILNKCFTELPAHGNQVLDVIVGSCSRSFGSPPEGSLHGVGVEDAHHPHHHAGGPLFAALHLEFATTEAKL